ncbi:MAG: propionate--CoA ligase [Betaproteobacteria bacterium]|nr:propionate--CoA ligase [Betaproteobacteria bacterium]MBU6513602.1 propionate--CoA ligase [Betaproteobacteria bacterium]MDE1957086.1 propionate--CoA ligase [Betaproteobacteria bacterium]MDE2153617.1 propionate--CoA ligase [Betaproteobacteria bacterium]MDE2479869.1 propionate--CoA ligase [Betaproteobacteria bacterium]
MADYSEYHRRSVEQPREFWAEKASLIDWHRPFGQVLDDSRRPFAAWFPGGLTNLCHNAVDRHLAARGSQPALVWESTEVERSRSYSYAELHREVQRMAAILLRHGVVQGDRVLIYMPMIPEAVFAMLACARIGAIHSVVFGGFAALSLATRIDDATPRLVISADAGSRAGRVVPYKPLLDEAIERAAHKPQRVLMIDRGLQPFAARPGRDLDYAAECAAVGEPEVPCAWVDSTHPSYILYTSGTTGRPKGVQRDTGGYAVALATSMRDVFCGSPGGTYFCTSDIGWVVGHSYIVYGPLIHGMTTVLYEGTPVRPDAGILWRLAEKHRAQVMFSSPTAVRVLKKFDTAFMRERDLSSLERLFLAGEPLDEPTASWIAEALGKPVVDNYWQTETGWPILGIPAGVQALAPKPGSPGVAMPGYKVGILDELSGEPVAPGNKGVLALEWPLPPGCMQTVWGDDKRFVDTYWSTFPTRQVYSTFDWGVADEQGYVTILGRTDDVINVAGHRLGTREIEESISSHAAVAEVAVVGAADELKGQQAVAFVVPRDATRAASAEARAELAAQIMQTVQVQLGAVARPARVLFVSMLPKTRSGKLLRRSIQALCEQRAPGDLTTLEDPAALEQIRAALAEQP